MDDEPTCDVCFQDVDDCACCTVCFQAEYDCDCVECVSCFDLFPPDMSDTHGGGWCPRCAETTGGDL